MAQRKKNTKEASGLQKVASKAKVSTGTVSRVFNNSSRIPPFTRNKVMTAARELGFRPRVGMRKAQIALVTEPPWKTLMGGYVNTVTQYICYELSKADAAISMITEDCITDLDDSWFDGIIGIAWEERTIEILKAIKRIPVVWLSDIYSDHFHSVYLNCRKTGKIAGEYLIAKGHNRIAVIHETDYVGCERAQGVALAMQEAGLDPDDSLIKIANDQSLTQAVKQLINSNCTAVWVTGEDMKVLEVNWLIQELAFKNIPDDISLMGFENPGISEFQRPAFTTIKSPLKEMSQKAVELVLQQEHNKLTHIEFDVEIIERNSVRSL